MTPRPLRDQKPLRAHQVKHGRIARPLGAADLYLFALLVVLGFALGLAALAVRDVGRAREAFRDELWQAGLMLEDADQLLYAAQERLRERGLQDDPPDETTA